MLDLFLRKLGKGNTGTVAHIEPDSPECVVCSVEGATEESQDDYITPRVVEMANLVRGEEVKLTVRLESIPLYHTA